VQNRTGHPGQQELQALRAFFPQADEKTLKEFVPAMQSEQPGAKLKAMKAVYPQTTDE